MLGGSEWLIIFFAILLLFGGKKIPELMRGVGKGIREFNAARSTLESELQQGMREAEQQAKRIESPAAAPKAEEQEPSKE